MTGRRRPGGVTVVFAMLSVFCGYLSFRLLLIEEWSGVLTPEWVGGVITGSLAVLFYLCAQESHDMDGRS